MLCQNHVVLPGSPSTCIIDTALVPLPSFLLLIAGAFVLMRWPQNHSRIVFPRWIHILYMVLVAAAIAMIILELARDSAANLGVGLIPMVLIGLIIVFVGLFMQMKGRTRDMLLLFSAYWLLSIIFQSIKVARLKTLERLDPGKSQYPSSDQLLDNAVILGLFVVFFVLEAIGLVLSWKKRSSTETNSETKPASA